MSIKAGELCTKIRIHVGDMQKTKYSDYEVLNALNEAVDMLYIAHAAVYSSIPQKRVKLRTTRGVASLPADYYSLVSKPSNATVFSTYIRCSEKQVTLVYNRVLNYANSMSDDIDIPLSLSVDAVNVACNILTNEVEKAYEIADACASRISQRREHSGIPDTSPWE